VAGLQTGHDGMRMDMMRAPFGIRAVEGIHYAPHLDFDRFEPDLDGNGMDAGAGFFYLCTIDDFKQIMQKGITGSKDKNLMRIQLEPFVPSDRRSSVMYQKWVHNPSEQQLLCCISIKADAVIALCPKVGTSGRYSIGGRSLIEPKDIESAWEYPDTSFQHPRLVYHHLLIREEITGYAGGDRTRPSAEVLASLQELITESAVSVSGTTTAGDLRLVPARDPSVLPVEHVDEQHELRVLILEKKCSRMTSKPFSMFLTLFGALAVIV